MNEENIVRIRCPYCRKLLAVEKQPGIETKTVTCPVCKKRNPFIAFEKVEINQDRTIYPGQNRNMGQDSYSEIIFYKTGGGNGAKQDSNSDETIKGNLFNGQIGKLVLVNDRNTVFKLSIGRNVLGRLSQSSHADIQIPTDDRNRMSREHLVIEVKEIPGKGFNHYVSLYKQKLNPTFISGEKLEFGDRVILKDNDIIELPDVKLKFIIPDIDKTDYTGRGW